MLIVVSCSVCNKWKLDVCIFKIEGTFTNCDKLFVTEQKVSFFFVLFLFHCVSEMMRMEPKKVAKREKETQRDK